MQDDLLEQARRRAAARLRRQSVKNGAYGLQGSAALSLPRPLML